jgi:hypothetical protein
VTQQERRQYNNQPAQERRSTRKDLTLWPRKNEILVFASISSEVRS